MRQTNISLTEPQIKQLAKQAKKTGLSKAEIIRRALDQYLKGN